MPLTPRTGGAVPPPQAPETRLCVALLSEVLHLLSAAPGPPPDVAVATCQLLEGPLAAAAAQLRAAARPPPAAAAAPEPAPAPGAVAEAVFAARRRAGPAQPRGSSGTPPPRRAAHGAGFCAAVSSPDRWRGREGRRCLPSTSRRRGGQRAQAQPVFTRTGLSVTIPVSVFRPAAAPERPLETATVLQGTCASTLPLPPEAARNTSPPRSPPPAALGCPPPLLPSPGSTPPPPEGPPTPHRVSPPIPALSLTYVTRSSDREFLPEAPPPPSRGTPGAGMEQDQQLIAAMLHALQLSEHLPLFAGMRLSDLAQHSAADLVSRGLPAHAADSMLGSVRSLQSPA
eukprot:TRINITY_DN9625_c0_g1_i2.p1 TRINITY_DN9625_c0_g1~~TRINITY_DN9625_c0_g1_i2.p1  ORF type:complete len:372 (+),score=66.53 TRINITY_DN9625_c0_g1_i2:92-1117(+)